MWNSSAIFPWPVFIPFDIFYDLQSAGQIIADAMEPGHHCHPGTESGVHSTDEEEKHSGTPETDTDAGKGTSLPRKDLQKSSAERQPHFHLSSFYPCFLLLPLLFYFQLMNMVTGGGWEALRGALKLTSDMNFITLFWIHWCLAWNKKKTLDSEKSTGGDFQISLIL